MHPEMTYKLCNFCENRARDTPLRGVYIPDFGQIWVKISILGVLHRCRCTDGGKILLHAKFHPYRCNVSPLRGEKPQNRPLSKLNTGRFALREMLPVKKPNVCGCHGGAWNLSPTKLGMVIEDLKHVLSPLKLFGVRCIVSPLRAAENLAATGHHELKTLITS